MSKVEDRFYKKRLRSAHITTLISITLVLLMLGFLGLIILHAKKVSEFVKENIGFTITLDDNAKESSIKKFQSDLSKKKYANKVEFISKEQAKDNLMEELGEDFVGFLGYNPLPSIIEVKLKPDYANNESIKKISKQLAKNKIVSKVDYQESMISAINSNIYKIGIVLLGFSIILILIAFALINNTIRLSVYSKRFLIKTMQLVGANRRFIRKPFMKQGAFYGIVGAIIAISIISVLLIIIHFKSPENLVLRSVNVYLMLMGIILGLGVFISLVSTYLSVSKYIDIQNDKLYQ